MSDPVPGLNSVQESAGKSKPPDPIKTKATGKGLPGHRDEIEKLLLPVTLAGGALLKPESFAGKKALTFLTGFKVAEGAQQVNKLTPGAGLFLLPEPFGFLPERFFMEKPRVPGTGIYFDPVFTVQRQLDKRTQEKRDIATVHQFDTFKKLLPTLSEEQLQTLFEDRELKQSAITLLDLRTIDNAILEELNRRKYARDRAAAQLPSGFVELQVPPLEELVLETVARALAGDLEGFQVLNDLGVTQEFFRLNPPDP